MARVATLESFKSTCPGQQFSLREEQALVNIPESDQNVPTSSWPHPWMSFPSPAMSTPEIRFGHFAMHAWERHVPGRGVGLCCTYVLDSIAVSS